MRPFEERPLFYIQNKFSLFLYKKQKFKYVHFLNIIIIYLSLILFIYMRQQRSDVQLSVVRGTLSLNVEVTNTILYKFMGPYGLIVAHHYIRELNENCIVFIRKKMKKEENRKLYSIYDTKYNQCAMMMRMIIYIKNNE